jgi:hypothetical protein
MFLFKKPKNINLYPEKQLKARVTKQCYIT